MSIYYRILMIKERELNLIRALQDAKIRFGFGCKLPELFVIRAVLIHDMLNTVNMWVHHDRAQNVFSTSMTLPIFMIP